MLERTVKFFFRVLLMFFSLLGIKYVLNFFNINIPYVWFGIMIAGMFGFYGLIFVIILAVVTNFM